MVNHGSPEILSAGLVVLPAFSLQAVQAVAPPAVETYRPRAGRLQSRPAAEAAAPGRALLEGRAKAPVRVP